MTEPASERPTPTKPLERRGPLPIEERVAQLEALLERLEGKSSTSSQELLDRQDHLDSRQDHLEESLDGLKNQVASQGLQLQEHGKILAGVQSSLRDVSGAVHRAAWATPAATTSGVGAVAAGALALGRIFGWW